MQSASLTMPLVHPASFEQEILQFLTDFKFEGPQPGLEHLTAVARYFSRLPYENISKIIKHYNHTGATALRLPDELIEDHFNWQLGGTCFSLTYLLTGIYTLLGYAAQPLICHLNWGSHNHSALAISYRGQRYLLDPGYMIFKPLLLDHQDLRTRLTTDTGLALRFQAETDTYAVFTFRKGQSVRRYQFTDRDVPYAEFADYWRNSFDLPGMDDLTLTRVKGYEMTYIQGDFIKVTSPSHIEKIRSQDQVEKIIRKQFGIPLKQLEAARHIIQQQRRSR